MNGVVISLFFMFSTFPLRLIESMYQYPYIFEELAKLVFVYALLKDEVQSRTNHLNTAIIGAVLFALSEDMLYLTNFIKPMTGTEIAQRTIFTSVLHVLTTVIIYFGCKKEKFYPAVAILLAVLIHFGYNSLFTI